MDRALEVVDEDRARDAEVVAQPTCGGELVLDARVCPEEFPRMCLARVEEVPAAIRVLRCELVEQRTLCCAIRSGERAELEDDVPLAPELG
jgi:hypothetical protein